MGKACHESVSHYLKTVDPQRGIGRGGCEVGNPVTFSQNFEGLTRRVTRARINGIFFIYINTNTNLYMSRKSEGNGNSRLPCPEREKSVSIRT